MLAEILRDTPLWTIPGLFFLIFLGYVQSKPRTISRGRAYILPLVMVALSVNGVISAFGLTGLAIIGWAIGAAVALAARITLFPPRVSAYDKEAGRFSMPGSWVPFCLLMALFVTKYTVGGMLAHHYPVTDTHEFVLGASLMYGAFSGMFFSVAVVIWRVVRGPALEIAR